MLNKARELKKYSLAALKNEKHFPKSTRWLYASPIATEVREACICIRHANSVYVTNFILIHEDKEFLQHCRAEIEKQVNAIGLELNGKTTLYPLRQGVKMLQWRFIVTDSGAIIRKMGKKKQSKQRRKLKKLYAKEQNGDYAPGTAHESLVSWLANAARGDTYHERRKMINFYKELEGSYREKQLPQTPRPG